MIPVSFSFFIYFLVFVLSYFYLFCYYRFFAKLNYYYYYYYTLILFFYKKLINFFASSVMFWDRCSGMFRILSTADQRVRVNFDFIPSRLIPRNKIIFCW